MTVPGLPSVCELSALGLARVSRAELDSCLEQPCPQAPLTGIVGNLGQSQERPFGVSVLLQKLGAQQDRLLVFRLLFENLADEGASAAPFTGVHRLGQSIQLRRNPSCRTEAVGSHGAADHNGQPDLVTYTPQADGSTGPLTLLKAASLSPARSWRKLGTGWNGLRLMTTTPDVTGDGHPDIVAVDSTGTLRIYHGDGRGGLPKRSTAGKGWGILRELAAAGDRTGGSRPTFCQDHRRAPAHAARLRPHRARGAA